jgi:hypothetical protein
LVWQLGHRPFFAAPHNTIYNRFNAFFDSGGCEAADGLVQDWREGVIFALPDFHVMSRVLGCIEAGNATTIFILPESIYTPWWQRLRSSAWAPRITIADYLSADLLVANVSNREHCFFGDRFTSRLLVLCTKPLRWFFSPLARELLSRSAPVPVVVALRRSALWACIAPEYNDWKDTAIAKIVAVRSVSAWA